MIAKTSIRQNNKSDENAPVETVEIKTETNIADVSKEDNIGSCISKTFDGKHNANIEITNSNIITSNKNTDLDKKVEQETVKNENANEIFTQTSSDPIKDENSDNYIDKQLSSIFEINTTQITNNDKHKTNRNTDNVNSDVENTNYDSDVNFDITGHENATSSDDESLAETVKKRPKIKRKPTRNTKEPKSKKSKTEIDKVELKNTKPKKHFLNPQFWKKISLTEEEAVREFKRREFDNDYYLKAKYKCESCFKGFSKNDMLVRHLKHWHDEVRFLYILLYN